MKRRRNGLRGLRGVAMFFAVAASTTPLLANIISNMNTGVVYPTIQQAHDAASAGHTLYVHPGEHTEWNITLTKNLTLRGGDPSNTIVQAWHSPSSAPSRVFTINNATCTMSGLTIRYGLVTNDHADGGGVMATGPTRLSNCVVVANACANGSGGGLAGSIYAERCAIVSNYAGGTDTYGGGAHGVVLSNCLVQGNTAQYAGGGAGWVTANTTTFRGNRAPEYEGGAAVFSTLVDCDVVENYAHSGGATFGCTLLRCRIAKNSCDISGGAMWQGCAEECLIESNTASFAGGAYEATLVNCEVTGNYASEDGGGVLGSGAERCRFRRNRSGQGGGAAADYSTLTSCLLVENSSSMMGGAASRSLLVNCTLVSNTAASEAGGIYESTARNCIFAHNAAPVAPHASSSSISNSCFFPGSYSGAGNLSADPRFVNAAETNYRLTVQSPCIETGWNEAWMTSATDLAGRPRLRGNRVDMGAYEHPVVCVSKGGSHTPPFETWATAATNLQAGVNAASNDVLVVVSNGSHTCANEWRITNRIVVRSLYGPDVTSVDGQNARRCAIVLTNAILEGLSFTNGRADSGGGVYLADGAALRSSVVARCFATNYGGGIFFGLGGGTAEHCVVRANVASNAQGGGIYARAGNLVRNCLVVSNTANEGGGLLTYQGGLVENCTVVGNAARGYPGSGIRLYQGGEVRNSIFAGNATSDFGYVGSGYTVSFTCSSNVPAGPGNITSAPQFRGASDYRLAAGSPCINAGTNQGWMTEARDLAQRPRLLDSVVDLGAYEFQVAYVAPSGTHIPPFGTLATAATNLQAALDWIPAGGAVRVAEGRYVAGVTNTDVACAVVTNPISVTALGAAGATVLDGEGVRRGLSLFTNAVVTGFTISNGWAGVGGVGGGVYITGGGTLVSCRVIRCVAGSYGGGVFVQSTGLLNRCWIVQNNAQNNDGGGVYLAGGGFLDACWIASNTARAAGGIFFDTGGLARNCVITGNQAPGQGVNKGRGGGALFWQGGGRIEHGTITANTADDEGGGVFCDRGGHLVNTIIYSNQAPLGYNNYNQSSGTWSYCCTDPWLGDHAVAGPPLLLDAYHLATNSPCLDVATEIISRDYDGMVRPLDGDDSGLAVSDIGAFELMNPLADSDWDQMPDGWEQQYYGSPVGCPRPLDDDDLDGDINRTEALADTNPLDANDWFHITDLVPSGAVRAVGFHSSSNRLYTLQVSSNATPEATWITCPPTDMPGQGGWMAMPITTTAPVLWSRVRVQVP